MTELRGLYAVTDSALIAPAGLEQQVSAALAGGARLVQYRDKHGEAGLRRAQAEALLRICRRAGVPLLINDDLALAEAIGADGVHLGRDDEDPAAARRRLGAGALIGVSCYGSLGSARRAQAAGADYVAFGSAYASPTKPQAPRVGLATLRQARAALRLPICAIGGITRANASPLLAAGVDLLAVISDLFASADVEAAAREFSALFGQSGRQIR